MDASSVWATAVTLLTNASCARATFVASTVSRSSVQAVSKTSVRTVWENALWTARYTAGCVWRSAWNVRILCVALASVTTRKTPMATVVVRIQTLLSTFMPSRVPPDRHPVEGCRQIKHRGAPTAESTATPCVDVRGNANYGTAERCVVRICIESSTGVARPALPG